MDLPPEIWLKIFFQLGDPRFLEPLSLVSKQFLTLTNSLYTTLSLKNPATQFLPSLFLRFSNLNSIDLSDFQGDPTSILLQIPRYCPHLHSLNLFRHKNLPFEAFREMSFQMKGLKVLDLSNLGVLNDNDLVLVADCFPHLEELDISCPRKRDSVTDAGITALSSSLKNLNRINISGNHSITDTAIIALSINGVFLKSIAISCCLVTPNAISCLLKNRPELEALSIQVLAPYASQPISFECARCLGSLDITFLCVPDEWLFLIGKGRFPLKRLNLSFSHGFSIEGLTSVLHKHRRIEHLGCQGVDFLTDNDISVLSGFLNELVFVNLNRCTKLTSMSFYYLAEACHLLKEVRMERVFRSEDEDSSIHYEINSKVRSLYLCGNGCLSDQCLKKFVKLCPNLQFIDVSFCPQVSEEAVLFIMKRCSQISHLNIAGCNVKNLEIDFDIPSLEVLYARVTELNGEALAAIGKRCCNLRYLNLSGCIDVSADGVKAVVENCKELREINVKGCEQLDADIVPWMVLTRPSLRRIFLSCGFKPSEAQRNFFSRHGCLVYVD